VAAPGEEPHTAVVPGNTFHRASKAPRDVLMTNTEQTPARNSGHCRAPGLSPARLADKLVDVMLDLRSDRDAAAALSSSVSGIVERRQPLRGAMRRQFAAILRAANPRLREKTAAEAAALIAHVLKIVPTLAKEEEDGGQALVAQARKMLAAYIERVVKP
jgi:hypothetical protein